MVSWLVGWLVDWLVGWLVTCLLGGEGVWGYGRAVVCYNYMCDHLVSPLDISPATDLLAVGNGVEGTSCFFS